MQARGVTKRFGPVLALDQVDFALARGEVRALLGKNGAGKSTLVKILSGAERPDAGELTLLGEVTHLDSPAAAQAAGIATVYQELSLVPGLTAAENISLGRWPYRRRLGVRVIDQAAMRRTAENALDLVEERLPLNVEVGRFSLAQRQIVEIAKAVATGSRVLILDEPTSSLAGREVDNLLRLVRRLAAQSVAVIYVSHRMQEIPRVADSLTVLRDGRVVGNERADIPARSIARLMLGEELAASSAQEQPLRPTAGRVLLAGEELTTDRLHGVSLALHQGEVLGLAGVLGSGRTEVCRALVGADPLRSGRVIAHGKPVAHPDPERLLRLGVALAPEDRAREGLVLVLSIVQNLTMAARARTSRFGVVSHRAERRVAAEVAGPLRIRANNLDRAANTLSGGNQQKVVIGKWLAAGVRVLLLDEPTRGVDIEAKQQIYATIRQLAQTGVAVLFVSSEVEELFEVCNRVLVLGDGRVIAERPAADTSVTEILALELQGAAA